MSWEVSIERERMVFKKATDTEPATYNPQPCAPFCKLVASGVELDANNPRILIDSLHCALDIIAPHALDPAAKYTCAICFKDAYHPKPHVCEKEME